MPNDAAELKQELETCFHGFFACHFSAVQDWLTASHLEASL